MKDLLVAFVEFLFDIDNDEEITPKVLLKLVFKILVFFLIVFLVIWLLQKIKAS